MSFFYFSITATTRVIPVLLLVGLVFAGCTHQSPTESTLDPDDQPTILLISMDGFRWDYTDRADTPVLDRLKAEGGYAESLIPVFPTKTFPNHYSIVTGLYPSNHGIVSNTMYDPILDAHFRLSDRSAVEDSRWWGGEPIWVTAEQQGLKTGTFFWPGTEAAIKNTRPTYWKRYDRDVPNEARIDTVVAWLELPADKRPSLLTLYFSDIDNVGHEKGPEASEVARQVRLMDELLGYLTNALETRNLLDQINLIITSDHGMIPLSRNRVIFLEDYINLNDVQIIEWYPMLALIPKDGREEAIFNALSGAHPELQVYKKADIPAELHYRDHHRIPPIIGLSSPGWAISTRDYMVSNSRAFTGGTHGYAPAERTMHGIFIAHGPAFKKGYIHPPLENIHIYSLMADILNLTPATHDGNLDVVRPFLQSN